MSEKYLKKQLHQKILKIKGMQFFKAQGINITRIDMSLKSIRLRKKNQTKKKRYRFID